MYYLCKVKQKGRNLPLNHSEAKMKDRIRQIMESVNMTQKTFAEYLGMSQAALSSIFNGRTKPTLNTVEAIRSKMPQIRLEWLISGEGEMYAVPQKPVIQEAEKSDSPIKELELDFGNLEKTISEEEKKVPNNDSVDNTLKNTRHFGVKTFDTQRRRITEIRVFYDDRTFESFVPKD